MHWNRWQSTETLVRMSNAHGTFNTLAFSNMKNHLYVKIKTVCFFNDKKRFHTKLQICLRNIQIILHEFNKLSKICVAFEWKPDFKELWSFWAHQTIHWEIQLRILWKQEKAIKNTLHFYIHSTRFQWRIKKTRSCDRPQIAWQKTSSKIAQFRTLQTLKRINSVGIHKALFYVHDFCYHMRKTKTERTRYTNTTTLTP